MSDSRDTPHPHRQALSDFMDGAADPDAVVQSCAAWRDNAQARADWHAYHLIGDVLRSDELAARAELDERFLVTLRHRLAGEPVVLAPASPAETLPFDVSRASPVRRRRGWLASAAVAAGFAAVAGVLVITRLQAPTEPGPVLAASPSSGALLPVASGAASGEGEANLADGKLIRDARLDRYLAAHKQYGNSSALVVPGGVLQRATTVAPER